MRPAEAAADLSFTERRYLWNVLRFPCLQPSGKRPSDGPATLDLGGGIERHVAVCFAAAYDRHHPLPIQAPLPEKIPAHATKRNFRASIIENNRNRHDLWAKRLSSPCLQGCFCCTHPRRRRREHPRSTAVQTSR